MEVTGTAIATQTATVQIVRARRMSTSSAQSLQEVASGRARTLF
jgi:hypothetical protein